ncbi:MAG TPA: tRNA preQ1(34) S-adenosylmethionine ribosyltransferase-isomerase QueA [Polyangia bacterium]|nr:tRNA preQ1(34) S-adenosylmethionine ribosyltransferase-isomerase QueA [Polyangia bacterium]
MRTADFHYDLPPDRIAATPAAVRDESRLLVMRRRGDSPNEHAHFRDIGRFLPPRSLLVVNDTRVMAARLRGRKATGGGFELLLTRPVAAGGAAQQVSDAGFEAGFDETWEALGRSLGNVALGSTLEIGTGPETVRATLVERGADGNVTVRLRGEGGPLLARLEAVGEVPLPPYIEAARREAGGAPDVDDRARYQTVYADAPGAVAAPTAGLHFTPGLLDALAAAGHEVARVTLHVGPGTFRPVKATDPRAHEMDEERYVIPEATAEAIARARAEHRSVIAVGTTVVRTLEAAAREGGGQVKAGEGATRLFILPGDRFAAVDGLITNFHLPESTLLMLVCAFVGERERVLATYREAVEKRYRFYSYGDAMFIQPERGAA